MDGTLGARVGRGTLDLIRFEIRKDRQDKILVRKQLHSCRQSLLFGVDSEKKTRHFSSVFNN